MDTAKFPQLMKKLYEIVSELETMFPERHFTPDGHMVGSIGESLAAYFYGLKLLKASTEGCDATKDGKIIEIKATQGSRVAFRSIPEYLLVLKIHQDGRFDEIYNGKGDRVRVFLKNKPRPSNGQYQVSLSKLCSLNKQAISQERIKRVIQPGARVINKPCQAVK